MLVQSWPTVFDAGPTLTKRLPTFTNIYQHRPNVSRMLGYPTNTRPMIDIICGRASQRASSIYPSLDHCVIFAKKCKYSGILISRNYHARSNQSSGSWDIIRRPNRRPSLIECSGVLLKLRWHCQALHKYTADIEHDFVYGFYSTSQYPFCSKFSSCELCRRINWTYKNCEHIIQI